MLIQSFSCAAGDEVESLLLVVELGLGVVDGGGAGGGSHEVQLGLGKVTGGGAHRRGDEGKLGVLVSLPLWGSLNLDLSLASTTCHKGLGIGSVNQVSLLPFKELLGMVSALGGQRSYTTGDMGELSIFPGLPLWTANNRDMSLASACSSHKGLGIGSVDQVSLLPSKELLGVVSALGGERSDAGGDMGQLGIFPGLPLWTANNLDLGRGEGQTGQ